MKLTKKQVKEVVRYLKSIQQPTTAKQFKKDWTPKKDVQPGDIINYIPFSPNNKSK